MSSRDNLSIVREVVRGRLEITKETSKAGSRITIRADRVIAILAVALIVVATIIVARV
jgi:hypothetical protein